MSIVGIVGGLGPESTVDYYQRIIKAWKRVDPSTFQLPTSARGNLRVAP